MEKIFTFKKYQILIEMMANLYYQGFINKKYLQSYMNNKGCVIYTEIFFLIPYRNLLFETGGQYKEVI